MKRITFPLQECLVQWEEGQICHLCFFARLLILAKEVKVMKDERLGGGEKQTSSSLPKDLTV